MGKKTRKCNNEYCMTFLVYFSIFHVRLRGATKIWWGISWLHSCTIYTTHNLVVSGIHPYFTFWPLLYTWLSLFLYFFCIELIHSYIIYLPGCFVFVVSFWKKNYSIKLENFVKIWKHSMPLFRSFLWTGWRKVFWGEILRIAINWYRFRILCERFFKDIGCVGAPNVRCSFQQLGMYFLWQKGELSLN